MNAKLSEARFQENGKVDCYWGDVYQGEELIFHCHEDTKEEVREIIEDRYPGIVWSPKVEQVSTNFMGI